MNILRWLFLPLVWLLILSSCAPVAPAPASVPPNEAGLPEAARPEPVAPKAATLVPAAPPTLAQAEAVQPTLPPAPTPTDDPSTPRSIVQSFYRWYFAQPMGEIMNKRTYHDSPYLSETFQIDTDYLLDTFKDTGGHDPFTCAQNTLPSLNVAEMFISGPEAYALAEVIIDNEVRHFFVIQLGKSQGPWQIDAIHCSHKPETTALAFYTWYLGYIFGDVDVERGAEILHNPLSEQVYRHSFFLTSDYIRRVDADLRSMQQQGGMADPFLRAQNTPVRFNILPSPGPVPFQNENARPQVTARLMFDEQSTHYLILDIVYQQGFWRVDNISKQEVAVFDPLADPDVNTASWQTLTDSQYGIHLRYPAGWYTQNANLSMMPDDDPLKRSVFLLAPGLDPNLPVLTYNVLEGTESQLIRYYITESHQQVTINGLQVWVDRETHNTRYVFRHPKRENTWLVIADNAPSMPGREKYAQALQHIIAPLLRSVTFE